MLLLLAIVINYYSVVYSFLTYVADILFILAMVLVPVTLYEIVVFNGKHRNEFPQRCKLATIGAICILMGGTISGVVTFVMLEPYHSWEYRAELSCPGSCVADLPLPIRATGSNQTFFNATEVSSQGQGYIEIMQSYFDNKPIPVLRVHWSQNFTLKVSASKDYRNLAMNLFGLYNSTQKKFMVEGLTVPNGLNFTVRVQLVHDRISEDPASDHWLINGKAGIGETTFSPERP